MKKLLCLGLLAVAAAAFTACSDDSNDGLYDGVNNSYVKYKVTIDDDLLLYYDITGTYADLDGNEQVVKITSTSPEVKKFEKTGVDVGKISPKMLIRGVRNDNEVKVDESKSYTIKNTYRVSWYSKTSTAGTSTDTLAQVLSGAKLKAYIDANPTLQIIKYGE